MLAGRVPRARGGPVQLWQYLLELLRDPARNGQIAWTAGGAHDWEFRLVEPDAVARAWGERKRKPRMNYEKLARGTLRTRRLEENALFNALESICSSVIRTTSIHTYAYYS